MQDTTVLQLHTFMTPVYSHPLILTQEMVDSILSPGQEQTQPHAVTLWGTPSHLSHHHTVDDTPVPPSHCGWHTCPTVTLWVTHLSHRHTVSDTLPPVPPSHCGWHTCPTITLWVTPPTCPTVTLWGTPSHLSHRHTVGGTLPSVPPFLLAQSLSPLWMYEAGFAIASIHLPPKYCKMLQVG